jgi:hypothetical protein
MNIILEKPDIDNSVKVYEFKYKINQHKLISIY